MKQFTLPSDPLIFILVGINWALYDGGAKALKTYPWLS
jgi:hypothetical protein